MVNAIAVLAECLGLALRQNGNAPPKVRDGIEAYRYPNMWINNTIEYSGTPFATTTVRLLYGC
jgi:hypothetical protein